MVLGGLDDAGPYLITPPNPTFQPLFTEAFNILSPGYIRVRLNVSRRDLIRLSIVGFASTFITIILGGSRKEYVRPPGAVIEDVFPIACVRCGRCAEACPTGAIKILPLSTGVNAFTPVVEGICLQCWECAKVCPSGALKYSEDLVADIGTAVIDKDTCIVWSSGGRCRRCYNVCRRESAGAIEISGGGPRVLVEECVGCGRCVEVCPRDAIIVVPGGAFRVEWEPRVKP